MRKLRRAVLLVTAFLLLVILTCGGLYLFLLPRILPNPPSPAPAVGRLALVGPDGNIYTSRPDGSALLTITDDASPEVAQGVAVSYQRPTWSPDGERIAFVLERSSPQGEERSLIVANADGSARFVAFRSISSPPFFVSWSPDGRYLAFLTTEQRDLSLRIVDPEEGPVSQHVLDRGSPLYFSWAPDSSALLIHIGGSWVDSPFAHISKFELSGQEPVSLSTLPASFLTPGWSPNGEHLLYAVRHTGDTNALIMADPSGQEEKHVTLFRGAISFLWSPNSDRVAYVVTPDPDLGTFGPVQTWDMGGDSSRVLTAENAFAFFWSPDGNKIAYLVPELGPVQEGGERLVRVAIYLADVESGETKWLASFVPSDPLRNVLGNFDQYFQAISFWSPDSRHFVYSGEGEVGGVGIWVVDVETGLRSQVAAGTWAAWSRE